MFWGHTRRTCSVSPVGSLKVLDYILSFLDSQCAHLYRPESLGFLDYTARLAGLYMASCDSVSPQIPECEWWRVTSQAGLSLQGNFALSAILCKYKLNFSLISKWTKSIRYTVAYPGCISSLSPEECRRYL